MWPVICRTWAWPGWMPSAIRRKAIAPYNRCAMAPPGRNTESILVECNTVQLFGQIGKTGGGSARSALQAESWRGPGSRAPDHGGAAGVGTEMIEPMGDVRGVDDREVGGLAGLE